VVALERNLIARDIGRALAKDDEAGFGAALARLADGVAFWRGVPAQANDLYSIMLASSIVEAGQRLAGDVLERIDTPRAERHAVQFDRILAPLPPEIAWQQSLAYEYRTFVHAIAAAEMTPTAAAQRCLAGTTQGGCLTELFGNAAFAPQATFNLHAANTEAMQRWLEAAPDEIDAARAAYAAHVEAEFVRLDDVGAIWRQMAYNYTGRILANVAIPKSDWALRIHDREALRRMIVIKRDALRTGVIPARMGAFLDEQPAELRDPYTSKPFAWDPLFREIAFEPAAESYWRMSTLRVGVGRASVPGGVVACTDAFAFDLAMHATDPPTRARFVSCGLGHEPSAWTTDEDAEPSTTNIHDYMDTIEARRHGDEIGIRVQVSSDGEVQAHELRMRADAVGSATRMQPLAQDASAMFSVELRQGWSEPMLAVDVRAIRPADFARAIAAATGMRLRGAERLSRQTLTFVGDISVRDALGIAAETGNRRLIERTPTEFAFE
jgi:hypothetical protein